MVKAQAQERFRWLLQKPLLQYEAAAYTTQWDSTVLLHDLAATGRQSIGRPLMTCIIIVTGSSGMFCSCSLDVYQYVPASRTSTSHGGRLRYQSFAWTTPPLDTIRPQDLVRLPVLAFRINEAEKGRSVGTSLTS
jgi:hypothetical protein